MKFFKWLSNEFIRQFRRTFIFPRVFSRSKKYSIANTPDTINSLINSNKSLSRFGDGELGWIMQKNVFTQNTLTFEKTSNLLSKRLLQVLCSNNPNLEIGLPNIYRIHSAYYKNYVKRAFKNFMSKLGSTWMNYLSVNKQYYNTDITRAFSSYKSRAYSNFIFHKWKKIWNNKDLLIVEGRGTRIGVYDNLMSNASSIHRIECPIINAFESYNVILKITSKYLQSHRNYLTLISLGPTATILSYDLCNRGFRAIDIGHIDIEYEWFLRHTECDIPYKFVNEIEGGAHVKPIYDKQYEYEIVHYVS